MADEHDIRDQIVARAQELFFAHGYCNVTTDQIATGLAISKKTLYQHFDSKEALLQAALFTMRDEMARELAAVVDNPTMPFDAKLRQIMTSIGARISRVNRQHYDDMRRRTPHLILEMERFRNERLLPLFKRLFAEGATLGVLRRDVDPELFFMMFTAAVESLMNTDTLARLPHSPPEVFRAVLTVMLDGMLTSEVRDRMAHPELAANNAVATG